MERLRPVDHAILEELTDGRHDDRPWGRDSPGRIAENIDFSSQHVINRLQVLEAAELVTKLDRGIYEITDDGISEASSEE